MSQLPPSWGNMTHCCDNCGKSDTKRCYHCREHFCINCIEYVFCNECQQKYNYYVNYTCYCDDCHYLCNSCKDQYKEKHSCSVCDEIYEELIYCNCCHNNVCSDCYITVENRCMMCARNSIKY